MIPKAIQIVKDDIDRQFLPFVRKPARYIGGEVNQVKKDLSACDVRVALCFPDIYEIAMSYNGLGILYEILNGIDGIAAERAFAPWLDAEDILRQKKLPLFTLESCAAVRDFDILGFSLTNELCYTNLLNMLDLAGLEIRSENRTDDDPIVIVGGQAANCAEPLSAFVDMFVLGEGEEATVELVELYRTIKSQAGSKQDFLLAAAKQFSYVYVPQFYDVCPDDNGPSYLTTKIDGLPVQFENAVVKDFDAAPIPEKPIVPFVQAVHERISVEIMRGCPGRCRFCQASFCRQPVRIRKVDTIVEAAKKQYAATGYDTVSLLSLSTADYPHLDELLEKLQGFFESRHVGVSVPSLKVQKQLQLLPKMMTSVRKGGLTIAVEAASENLRMLINKPITNEDLFAAVRAAFEAGFLKVKLYFMVGFPGETEDDITQIADLAYAISSLRKEVDGKVANINAAVSWLVPKPHTPFGWLGQKDRSYFENARRLILRRKDELRARFLQFKFHPFDRSILESAMGRGDRRFCEVIETAWRKGAKFDLWNEGFDLTIWQEAFETAGLNLEQEAQKGYDPKQRLPWSHLGGPDSDYLLKHYHQAMNVFE
ncbi:MAG: TIGR03960 family B12-binding radical SAM protein [Phycisphaerae bacterium]|nr:TIGR03960 family B12-binding radical SAM protein [Phycisphaerae bacterium]